MEGISDIRICGIDEKRPPIIRSQPYIDLFFKLTHQAPKEWCDDFNQLVSKSEYATKINPKAGLFIETWVRTPDEISSLFDGLKEAVTTCTLEYIAKIEEKLNAEQSGQSNLDDSGEQGKLNRIIAALDFND